MYLGIGVYTIRHPEEVVITDIPDATASSGPDTPAENEDDFFSSWDKPTIKRPSNPPSRTSTPPVAGRTGSPFLNAPANGPGRPKSPLSAKTQEDKSTPTPRAVPSAAVRKSTAGNAPRKANILGAKKKGLGAKKVAADAGLDFDAAEKKAKEEAERIEKLGYDPDAEEAEATAKIKSPTTETTNILSPTPLSPGRGGFGATGKERSSSEMERLGMGIGRLGFGQTAGSKPAPAPKKMGFGATSKPVVGELYAPTGLRLQMVFLDILAATLPLEDAANLRQDDSERFAREKFGTQKGISSDEFFGRNAYDPSAQNEAKQRLQGFDGATSISSNAYFGRPEEEESREDYGDLETAAKDFVRRFGITAADDIENLTSVIGDGATKLQGAIRAYLNS